MVTRHMVPFTNAKVLFFYFLFFASLLQIKILPFLSHEKECGPTLLRDPFQKKRTNSHDTFWFFLAWPWAFRHLALAESATLTVLWSKLPSFTHPVKPAEAWKVSLGMGRFVIRPDERRWDSICNRAKATLGVFRVDTMRLLAWAVLFLMLLESPGKGPCGWLEPPVPLGSHWVVESGYWHHSCWSAPISVAPLFSQDFRKG